MFSTQRHLNAKCRRFDGNESRANAAHFISTSMLVLWTPYLLTISINMGNALLLNSISIFELKISFTLGIKTSIQIYRTKSTFTLSCSNLNKGLIKKCENSYRVSFALCKKQEVCVGVGQTSAFVCSWCQSVVQKADVLLCMYYLTLKMIHKNKGEKSQSLHGDDEGSTRKADWFQQRGTTNKWVI